MFKPKVTPFFTPEPGPLVVLVPAMGQRCARWDSLRKRLSQEAELKGADWVLYDHNLHLLSSLSLFDAAKSLAAQIHEVDEYRTRDFADTYSKIILIGHGVGGLLVRMAYLIGLGSSTHAIPRQEWSQRVRRIVLFATLNRGFDPMRWGIFTWFMSALLLIPAFKLFRSYLQGSSNIANLRISWINQFRQLENGHAMAACAGSPGATTTSIEQPTVIQINGVEDRYLAREDNADVDQFSKATQVDLPGVGRKNTFHLIGDVHGKEVRYASLRNHILRTKGDARADHTNLSDEVTHVVFLVHGIRAYNSDWPKRAADIMKREYPTAIAVAAGYPYFSALNFAIPFMRRRQIRWMQDEYSNQFSKYKNARFYFIGHSNGTYLLARLLEHVPSARFERVTLVGAVLPQDFDWNKHIREERVVDYRNHRAARDIPVGLLCNMLCSMGMRDIGTAGFDGFSGGEIEREVFFYRGGHGSALKDKENLTKLIRYTLEGGNREYSASSDFDPKMLRQLSRVMPLLTWIFVAVLCYALATARLTWTVFASSALVLMGILRVI